MNINATLIGQTIAFLFFVWFCVKYVWPPIIAAIEERQKTIAEGLAAAERGAKDQELAQERAAELLREAKQKAAELIEQANKRHAEIVEAAKTDALAEVERVKAGALAELEQEKQRAKEILRKQLGELAVAGASKIIERSINEQDHRDLLEKLAEQL